MQFGLGVDLEELVDFRNLVEALPTRFSAE